MQEANFSSSPARVDLLDLTANIVAAHVTGHQVAAEAVPELVRYVYAALKAASTSDLMVSDDTPRHAVPIKKSVFPDYLVCLEDGKQFQMLKRHLRVFHGMTPDEYRQRWKLPASYPMAASNFAAQRAEVATRTGLGRRTPLPNEPTPVIKRIPEGMRGKRTPRQTGPL